MKKFRVCLIALLLISPAFSGTGRTEQMSIIQNLVNALNYDKYEQFIQNGSPEWRKTMTRAAYNKIHKQMSNYIGHILTWKPLSKRSKDKIQIYTYRLTGDSESIGLIMQVQMYEYKQKLVVNSVSFVKR